MASHQWLHIGKFISDRHLSIAKWIRENMPHIQHLYDIWHVARGISRKLEAAAKLKRCEVIRSWIQSISNNLHWCAVSAPAGDGDLIVAKWKSIINHIQNIHDGHPDERYPKCEHESLIGREAQKRWIKCGSKAAFKLEEIVLKNKRLKDISKLSGDQQTSNIEAFHSLLIQFAPKNYVFGFNSMKCRSIVAKQTVAENKQRLLVERSNTRLLFQSIRRGDRLSEKFYKYLFIYLGFYVAFNTV